jgi:hypothetical protein
MNTTAAMTPAIAPVDHLLSPPLGVERLDDDRAGGAFEWPGSVLERTAQDVGQADRAPD